MKSQGEVRSGVPSFSTLTLEFNFQFEFFALGKIQISFESCPPLSDKSVRCEDTLWFVQGEAIPLC